MKVLMISGDPKLLEPHTEAHERFLLQCAAVDELRLVVWSPRAPFAVLGALGAVLTTRFDVVTAQDPLWRGLLALVLARLGGAKLQIQVHQNVDALLGINRAIFKAVVKRADAIRAVSETIKAQVERAGARVYVDVLPVFIDLEVLKRAPAADLKKEFPQFGKTVFWIGRLEAEKNPKGAIDVFARVVREFPGAGLIIAGEGSQHQELLAYARNVGLASQVVLTGYRPDAPSLCKSADVSLVTSWAESWGASIVEALAVGCCVVAPDVGVAREAGAIVAGRDQLADAVIQVLKSGTRGQLKINVLGHDEWVKRWRDTLINTQIPT